MLPTPPGDIDAVETWIAWSSDRLPGSSSVTTARFAQDSRRAFSSFPPGFAFTMTRRTSAEASHHGTRLHRSCPATGTWSPSSWTVSPCGWASTRTHCPRSRCSCRCHRRPPHARLSGPLPRVSLSRFPQSLDLVWPRP